MPRRDALRNLQERLSERMQSSTHSVRRALWLAVIAHGGAAPTPQAGRYLLPLAEAGEVFPFVTPSPVPHTRPWFLGVAHLRGGLWGAVDLAAYLAEEAVHQTPDARPRLPVTDARCGLSVARLITLHPDLGSGAALRIDRLVGLRAPDAFTPAPRSNAGAAFGPRYVDAQGQTWQSLDLVALSRESRFLSPAQPAHPAVGG
jgi:twitching motility protein PilI